MILNSKKWLKFEKDLIKKEKATLPGNFKIMDALYKEAVQLKIFPLKNPLEGIDVLIRVAKAINSV